MSKSSFQMTGAQWLTLELAFLHSCTNLLAFRFSSSFLMALVPLWSFGKVIFLSLGLLLKGNKGMQVAGLKWHVSLSSVPAVHLFCVCVQLISSPSKSHTTHAPEVQFHATAQPFCHSATFPVKSMVLSDPHLPRSPLPPSSLYFPSLVLPPHHPWLFSTFRNPRLFHMDNASWEFIQWLDTNRSSVLEVFFIRGETMEVCILPGESYPLAFLLISVAGAWPVKKHLELCNLKSDNLNSFLEMWKKCVFI